MYYWSLTEDTSKTTARWLASISEAMEAWNELAKQVAANAPAMSSFDPAAGMSSFTANTDAGLDASRYAETLALFVRAHNASMTAALEGWRTMASMRGANLTPNPFGLTGVFTSEAPKTAPAGGSAKAKPAVKREAAQPVAIKTSAPVEAGEAKVTAKGAKATENAEPKAKTAKPRKPKASAERTLASPVATAASSDKVAKPVKAKTLKAPKVAKASKPAKVETSDKSAASAKAPKAKTVKLKVEAAAVEKPAKAAKTVKASKPAKAEKSVKSTKTTKTASAKPATTLAGSAPTVGSPKDSAAAKADDFTRISGVGPKMMQTLRDLGYRRFADLAGMTPADVDALETKIKSRGRIIRDAWVRQAQTLMHA